MAWALDIGNRPYYYTLTSHDAAPLTPQTRTDTMRQSVTAYMRTQKDAEHYISTRVAVLAAPGSFTARMFAQGDIVSDVLTMFGELFSGREADAAHLVGTIYAESFPQK